MKGRKKKLLAGILAVFALGAGVLFFPGGAKIQIDIPPGLSARQTAELLSREGVLPSVFLFRTVAKVTRLDRSLKPGRYILRKNMSPLLLLRRLHEGDTEHVRVVIPEGFMAKQIADRLEAEGVTSSAAFMEYVEKNNLEGRLFPTTYFFNKGLTPESVAHHMHLEFQRWVVPEFEKANQTRFTLDQIVTLASIVQREARLQWEMPTISAVYRNRLKRRMRLEADPTVQYALGRKTGVWKKGMRYKDLAFQSPYNMYINFGLPPGPICSPGVEAVRAALNPADTEAIYFVADNSGGHTFTSTLADHNRAKEKAKRERLQQQK